MLRLLALLFAVAAEPRDRDRSRGSLRRSVHPASRESNHAFQLMRMRASGIGSSTVRQQHDVDTGGQRPPSANILALTSPGSSTSLVAHSDESESKALRVDPAAFFDLLTAMKPEFKQIKRPKRPNGIGRGEALSLAAMLTLTKSTHFFESGTAFGESTELIARQFEKSEELVTSIVTIDFDELYHQFNLTKERLSKYPRVKCINSDSRKILPGLISALQPPERAGIFIDGPKYQDAFQLATSLLDDDKLRGRIAFVALHDVSPVYLANKRLYRHKKLQILSNHPRYNATLGSFGELDRLGFSNLGFFDTFDGSASGDFKAPRAITKHMRKQARSAATWPDS